MEKIYVAVGDDLQEGFKTLEWVLQKWPPADNPVIDGIVLVHVSRDISKEFVYGPYGKFPASSVNEEELQVLKKQEQDKIDSLLHKYIAFCGKLKAEDLKIEKYDETIHELLVGLISGLHMTKLVLDLTFMKFASSTSRKSGCAVTGLLHIHHHKPDFCELHIVCGGKPVYLREDDAEGVIEDDQGMIITMRDKRSFKGWLGKMMSVNSTKASQATSQFNAPTNQWEDHVQEIGNYFQQLLSADGSSHPDEDAVGGQNNQTDSALRAQDDPDNWNSEQNVSDKLGALKRRMEAARQTIERKRTEAKTHLNNRLKAERATRLCNRRIEYLGTCIEEETATRVSLQKDLEFEREQLQEAATDTEESKRRLNLLAEFQTELSNKLRILMLSKAPVEARLEKTVLTREEIVREIEELRRQRDVLCRRIEFCRERDVIEMVSVFSEEPKCGYREYTPEDIRLATDDFSDCRRIKSMSHRTNIYRGCIDCATAVAIKMSHSSCGLSPEAFKRKIRLLSQIRHPHVVAMIGFCSELKCIILEYMHNGSLQDILCSSTKRNWDFMWHDRVRVAHEISLGLGFLHSAKPRPIIHGNLTPSNILLDRNLIAKLGNSGLVEGGSENSVKSVVRAFGHVMLYLLTGSNSAVKMDTGVLAEVIDKRAGNWPWDLAEGFAEVAMRCLSVGDDEHAFTGISPIIEELGRMRREAEAHVTVERDQGGNISSNINRSDDSKDIPSSFLCPIFQEIMQNPHVAADGFSYELEAIEEWLWTRHDTSPMTNLRLDHKLLTPNHTLRSLIRDWQSQQSHITSPED